MGKKSYTKEFKDTIRSLYKNGKTVVKLYEEYGIPQSTIRQWCIYDEKRNEVIDGTDLTMKEFKKMKKEYRKMKEENEILKKALTIFAKN